jgi:predicted molibdopterin-dependent oxidoreductase YjgC
MDTVTLTIDGRQMTVEKGKTVLQAAIENGISVPYYCYHPGIGIDGSCRVCIVKIEKMPKLQTSCSTVCTDGVVVSTRTSDVVEAPASPIPADQPVHRRCATRAASARCRIFRISSAAIRAGWSSRGASSMATG